MRTSICAAVLAVGGLGACDAPEGVLVHLTLPSDQPEGQEIDRVRVSGVADDDEAFEPAFFPDPPRVLDPEGETLTVLVDDELIGEDLVLSFEAQRGREIRATGFGSIDVARDKLVELDVDLSGAGDSGNNGNGNGNGNGGAGSGDGSGGVVGEGEGEGGGEGEGDGEGVDVAPIVDVDSLQAAIAAAAQRAGRDELVIEADLQLVSTLVIDECAVACPHGAEGVVLRGAGDGVGVDGALTGTLVRLQSPGIELHNLRLSAPRTALEVVGAAVLDGVHIDSDGGDAVVARAGLTVRRSLITRRDDGRGKALTHRGASALVLEQTVISGGFDVGVDVDGATDVSLTHATVIATAGLRGLSLKHTQVCARNSVAVALSVDDVVLAAGCDSGRNALALGCTGRSCEALCPTTGDDDEEDAEGEGRRSGPLCDVVLRDLSSSDGSCPAAGSGLVDAATDVGFDLVDDGGARWVGDAPDIGGRERGSDRSYAGTVLSCR